MKLLYVVHRYAPFPGGSEYNVQRMAEESFRQGHDVTVFAGEHKGDYNGVKVTNDTNIFAQKWDLIIVHGGDVAVQNFVHIYANKIKEFGSKILYLLIKPSESQVCLHGMQSCDVIGCLTNEDWDHVKKWGVEHKSVQVRYGLVLQDTVGTKGKFREKFGIPKDKKMFLSCGGYWPNKKMIELADAFREANLNDAVLVTTGYDNRHNLMPHASETVIPLMVEDVKDIKDAYADADCYIMNSDAEGFGLVLIESMLNKTPWISRNIAAATMLSPYGMTYNTENELVDILKNGAYGQNIDAGYNYVLQNHLIHNTVKDILAVI